MKNIYVGTAGWSYDDWVGSFYPKKQTKDFDWLVFYSRYFNTVEVNASYYTYLSPKVVEGWLNKIEAKDDFLFNIKLHQDFTHSKRIDIPRVNAVKYNLDILSKANRLGGLLIQFPYSFELNKDNANHVKNLIDAFPEYEKFVEVRHKSWLIERFFKFIGTNKTSLCAIDQPIIGEAVEFKPIIAGDNLYLRFHGRNTNAWKNSFNNFGQKQTYAQQSERYNYFYTLEELEDINKKIKDVFDAVKKIYVILNNHPQGNAVANALELIHMLSNKIKIDVPETTLKTFPRLSKISLN